MSSSTGPFRWFVKKAARRSLAVGSQVRSWVTGRGSHAPEPAVHVLTYHRFANAPRDPFCVRAEDFEQQMAWIAQRQLAISLSDLKAFQAGRSVLPNNAVLVTVDDGFSDFYSVALPILKRYRIPAVAFVPVGRITEQPAASGRRDDAYLSWPELADLASSGVSIASHGWDHISLGILDSRQLAYQVTRSRAELERRLGILVDAFAYPFGTRRDFGPATERALADAGYTQAFTAQHGAVRTGANPLSLPRIKVEGGEGMGMFRLLVTGALDGWQWVDRALWRLQTGDR